MQDVLTFRFTKQSLICWLVKSIKVCQANIERRRRNERKNRKRDRLVCWYFCSVGIVKQCGGSVCLEYKVGCYLLLRILFVLPACIIPSNTAVENWKEH
jgi:membrane-anchored glycerophosphoryl diester phosphodiesterase (GDPDase)